MPAVDKWQRAATSRRSGVTALVGASLLIAVLASVNSERWHCGSKRALPFTHMETIKFDRRRHDSSFEQRRPRPVKLMKVAPLPAKRGASTGEKVGSSFDDDEEDFFGGDGWLQAADDDPLLKTIDSFHKEGERRKVHAQQKGHVPVQELEAIDKLLPPFMQKSGDFSFDGVYADGTFGRGGHSRSILSRLSEKANLYAFDVDPTAIAVARELEEEDERFNIFHRPFGDLGEALAGKQLHGVLLDVGVSNRQVEDEDRGFQCYGTDGPLDLRMNQQQGIPASEWLMNVTAEELAWVLYEYGEDKDVHLCERIAEAILIWQRQHGPYKSARDFSDVVRKAKRAGVQNRHPAKLTFQAIRMFLNHEMDQLRKALDGAFERLVPGGRCVVITFKSMESKVVYQFINDHEDPPEDMIESLPPSRLAELYPLVGKKTDYSVRRICLPARPRTSEVLANPRARSSSLIVMQKAPRHCPEFHCEERSLDLRLREPTPPPFVGNVDR